MRYNSTGNLLNSTSYDGGSNLNDIAVSINIHPVSGAIIVAASTENSNTSYDYLVLKYNTSLNLGAFNTYDYDSLIEVPSGIEFSATGDICLIGASASSSSNWDYAVVVFDQNNLTYVSDTRSNISGIGFDQPLSFCKDNSGNIYITGRASTDGINYNIRTIKILANLTTISWSQVYDGTANLDDSGNSIAVDQSGNVIVGGFSTASNGKKNMICQKYNGSTGSLIWQYNRPSEDPTGDAFIKTVGLNGINSNIYFVGGEKNNMGYKQSLLGKIMSTGDASWLKTINNSGNNVLPSDLEVTNDGIYVISVLDGTADSYLASKFTELELDSSKSYSGGHPQWQKRELIVSFSPSAIDTAAIDNHIGSKIMEFGTLNDFLTASAYTSVINAFEETCRNCDIKVVKIFDNLKTTDVVTTSRLGQNVPIPSFWSTLLLQFPNSITLQQAGNVLKTIPDVVSFSHPNYIAVPLSPPNDSLYNLQTSLSGTTTNNINVDEAWGIVQSCGASFIKAGVFDSGVNWKHPDFGYTGSQTSGKVQGWHFISNSAFPSGGVDIRDNSYIFTPDGNGHGSMCAGIIGAERNNSKGIAGIAGGDATVGNSGISLYSLNTGNQSINWKLKAHFETSLSGTTTAHPYRYGLNVSNHSYKIGWATYAPDSFASMREMVHFANRMQVCYVASRGNDSINNQVFPACFDSSWVLSVGGSGLNAQRWLGSSYGSGMDVVAP